MSDPYAGVGTPVEAYDPYNGIAKRVEPAMSWGEVPIEAAKNLPGSAYEFGANIAHAVAHPINTLGSLADIGAGALRAGARKVLPRAAFDAIDSIGNQEANKRAQDAAAAAGQFYADRYGSAEGIKRTLAHDPVGALADASAVLTGGGAALSRAPGVAAQIGRSASTVGNAIDPLSATIRGVAGATRPARNIVSNARANQGVAGAYGEMVSDLGRPVSDLADEIAVGATTSNIAGNRRALDILGEEMARSGDAQAAQRATIDRIARETGVTPQSAQDALNRVSSVHRDSPLMLGEYPAVSQSDMAMRGGGGGARHAVNVNLDEIGAVQPTAVQGRIDYLANNGNTQSAQAVRQAVDARQPGLAPQMRSALEDMAPRIGAGRGARPMQIADTDNLIESARNAASQEYRLAHSGTVDQAVALQYVPAFLNWHRNRAAMRAGDFSDAINRALDQFYIRRANGDRIPMQTLQQMQDARAAVRNQLDAYRAQGNRGLINAVQPVYDHVTRIMEAMSPAWGRANRRWADLNFEIIGQELGDALAMRAGPQYRRQVATFRGLAPEAQDIVRVHALQKMYDKLDSLNDTHSVSKLFANDHSRNVIRTLFGDEAAITFARAVRDQKVAEASKAMTGNSRTHMRGMAQRQSDVGAGIVAALHNASIGGLKNWIVERTTHILTERKNRPLADIVTTPMRDTPRVAEHLYRMRQQEQRLQQIGQPSRASQALRPLTSRVLRPASPFVGPVAGIAAPRPEDRRGLGIATPR